MAAAVETHRIIDDAWQVYSEKFGPGAPLREMRLAFFFGAVEVFNAIVPKDPTTQTIVELHRMILIDKELDLFVKGLDAELAALFATLRKAST